MSSPDDHEFWNRRYASDDYVFGTAPNAFLASQLHRLQPGQRALSVADGEGRNSVWLAEQGLAVTAVEFSANAIEKARKLAAERGVSPQFELADVLRHDWGRACFDVVAGIFIQFASPAERAGLFARMKDALAPGGLLFLQGYTPQQLEFKTGGPPCAENMYTEAILRDAFGDMDILHLREHDEDVHEGGGHSGRSALIDLVARR